MGLVEKEKKKINSELGVEIKNNLTLEEVEIIIRVMGSASFPVKDIEPLYRAIYKLQELRNKLK
jgi:hypothetical protein